MVGDLLSPGHFLGNAFGMDLRLERPIARSTLAVVWSAVDDAAGRSYAVKVRPRRDRGQSARILREAAALARINVRGVPRIFDVMVTPELVAVAMPLLRGVPLSRLPEDTPAARRIVLALQAVEVVARVHRAGLVHDNLCPENFFLAQAAAGEQAVFLTGFSSARGAEVCDDASTFGDASPYVAPERPLGPPSMRADVFSLARSVVDLVAGAPSRRSRSHGAPAPVDLLTFLLLPSLAEDPAVRPADAAVLSRRLRRVASSLG